MDEATGRFRDPSLHFRGEQTRRSISYCTIVTKMNTPKSGCHLHVKYMKKKFDLYVVE